MTKKNNAIRILKTPLSENSVYVAKSEIVGYCAIAEKAPVELPENISVSAALYLLRDLLRDADLDYARYGTVEWNPLGDLIKPGDKVLLKPNWVLDKNKLRGGSLDCLITHTSVIEAVLHYVVKARPRSIIVGDAPLQDCDFESLRSRSGLNDMIARFNRSGHDIQIRDFRLTKIGGIFHGQDQSRADPENSCLFDLGESSWLTPISHSDTEFRVMNYDPDALKQTQNTRTHRYLIARPVIDADVVISLPKLKTHKMAGITGPLKNMVGINACKEFLPHHRKGGSLSGGDCYKGGGWLKKLAEDSLDRANRRKRALFHYFVMHIVGLTLRLESLFFKGDRNLEGAWYGNDTVWRMCLDSQMILHFGDGDGRICDSPQRTVITITDAIIAGDGNGPLAPTPVPLGVMTLGLNVAALEWVHCLLMRLDPGKIPLVRNAFKGGQQSLSDFSPTAIRVYVNGELLPDMESVARFSRSFSPAAGWRGHCEKS